MNIHQLGMKITDMTRTPRRSPSYTPKTIVMKSNVVSLKIYFPGLVLIVGKFSRILA